MIQVEIFEILFRVIDGKPFEACARKQSFFDARDFGKWMQGERKVLNAFHIPHTILVRRVWE